MAAKSIVKQQKIKQPLWVGDESTEFESIDIKDFRSKLGQEYDCLILDCFSGFRASAAMALSGIIKAKGCMILVCPELKDWPSFQDPQQINRCSYGYDNNLPASRFIQYLTSCFNEQNFVAVLTQNNFNGVPCYHTYSTEHDPYIEQKQAVTTICKVAKGRNNRPLVLTADRGRGKSSALGIAAAQLMQTHTSTIWLTAPHIRNVEQVFSHALRLMPEAILDNYNLSLGSSVLAFKPIDQLLQSDALPDILLVDEASAIPVHILIKLTQQFTRIVFSSTVHGYEGSGRGFEIKFKQRLMNIRPQFKALHLAHPIRWFNGDALEAFWFKTLFYQSKQDVLELINLDGPIEYKVIGQSELLANKNILAQVFTLLLDAHYQTSPDDLQRLLDPPEIKCLVIMQQDTVLGVAQIIQEGGDCLKGISENIAANTKRVKGHLVAQNIASSYNQPIFAQAKQWRISRIAVKSSHQRMGLAGKLITYIESLARQDRIEVLTVAFGATAPLLRFWHRLGYVPVKLSLKPEISSGEHSCILIKVLSKNLDDVNQEITTEFLNDLLFYLDKDLSHLSAEVLLEILVNTNNKITCPNIEILKQFIDNTRSLSSCRRVLVNSLLSQLNTIKLLTNEDQRFLINLLLQNRAYQDLVKLYGVTGKKQIEQKVRKLFALLF